MGRYHVFGVAEDDLKPWRERRREIESNVGRTVVAMCLDGSRTRTSSVGMPNVDYLADTDYGSSDRPTCRLWMWELGDSVCIADLSEEDIDLAIRVAFAVQRDVARRDDSGEGGQGSSTSIGD
jgi:hypothetical protein